MEKKVKMADITPNGMIRINVLLTVKDIIIITNMAYNVAKNMDSKLLKPSTAIIKNQINDVIYAM